MNASGLYVLPVVAIGNENHGNSSSPGNAHNALSVCAVDDRMAGEDKGTTGGKLSTEFAARLAQLGANERVRVIVMVDVKHREKNPRRRMSRDDRKAAVEAIRGSSKDSLVAIDDVLQRFGGTRLAPAVDALGCLPVEATPSGIKALSASPGIKAILEDQDITPLPKPKS